MAVIDKGTKALRVRIAPEIAHRLIDDCFGNVGILQQLMLLLLDEAGIFERCERVTVLDEPECYTRAAEEYARQVNAIYQQFAKVLSAGIRARRDSTGIYAHAMKAILETPDDQLIRGIGLDELTRITRRREPRISKQNLRVVLKKLEELQVKGREGRGLVIAFDEGSEEISVVDRQLLFYRKYLPVEWPWDHLIAEASADGMEQLSWADALPREESVRA